MSGTAASPPEPAAPAAPTFATLFGEILTKVEAAMPSLAGLEALWNAHRMQGHLLGDQQAQLKDLHAAVTSEPAVVAAPAPSPVMGAEHRSVPKPTGFAAVAPDLPRGSKE